MDEQINRERTGSSQDTPEGQAGAKPDPHGTSPAPQSEGKPSANAAESGPADQFTNAGNDAHAGE